MAEMIQNDQLDNLRCNDWFFKATAIDELAREVRPLERLEDLAIEGLTPEEARSFLDAIRE